MLTVIGAGLGRTGTHSLGRALEILGFGPCYNILEVHKNPGHALIWDHAMDRKAVDWDLLFAAYPSAVEWPTVAFLSEVIQHFSEAKVVLTLRDPASWYESANTTIFDALELSAHHPDPEKRERMGLLRRLILERTFAGRYREKQYALEVYRQHNQSVIEMVPPDRLLPYHVKDGWRPLCEFLGKPIPEEQFPRLNDRTVFLSSAPNWAKKRKQELNRCDMT